MNPSEFWQNFRLGEEQEIAAGFIYDGLRQLHELENLNSQVDIFPILYNLAIGIERLLKVSINLIEFDKSTDVAEFQKRLKTHKHVSLFNRIDRIKSLELKGEHLDFLNLLSKFYNSERYDRLTFSATNPGKGSSKEVESFLDFLNKYVDISLIHKDLLGVKNTDETKAFIGGIVSDIVKKMRDIIYEQSRSKNIYTHEISSSSSKAAKILYGKERHTFAFEDKAMIELIIYLVNLSGDGATDLMRTIDPIDFDEGLIPDYIKAILYKNPRYIESVIDEIDYQYDNLEDKEDRFDKLNHLINMDHFN